MSRETAAPAPLRLSCITDLEGIRALQPEWDALLAATPGATPFQSAAWALATFTHLAADHQPRIIVVRDAAGGLAGVAACSLFTIRPFGVRLFYLFAYHHLFTEYIDAVLRPDVAEAATRAIFAYWHRQRGRWDLLVLPTVRAGSPFVQGVRALAAGKGYHVTTPTVWGAVRQPLPASWPAFYDSLTRNTRKYIKKFANRLHREGYQEQFEVIDRPEGLEPALDLFFDLHHRRAAADLSPPHPDYFATAEREQFLRAIAHDLMDKGKLRIGVLRVGGEPVAIQLCIIHAGVMHAYYSGFDPNWAWYGVMGNLIRRCIAYAIEQGCTTLDLGLGVDYEKRRWGGESHPVISLVLSSPRLRSRAAFAAFLCRGALQSRLTALRDCCRRTNGRDDDGRADQEGHVAAPLPSHRQGPGPGCSDLRTIGGKRTQFHSLSRPVLYRRLGRYLL